MEHNVVRLRSQLLRSLGLMRTARATAKQAPRNIGATTRRRDRTLAAWSLSRKVLASMAGTGLRGAAKAATVRKAGRKAAEAKAAWVRNYQSGHAL
jgi:hypothetical protein